MYSCMMIQNESGTGTNAFDVECILLVYQINYYCCHIRLDVIQNAADDGFGSGNFDRIRGEDAWIGLKVKKKFWVGKGKNKRQKFFQGTITACDDDEDNPGHRIFQITYDDGDEEWLSVANTHDLLTASKETVDMCKLLSF